MTIFTIGFTKKSAEQFFGLICGSGASRLVDVRLHKSSQLAGFAKEDDLRFFLAKVCNVDYHAEPGLAPEADMLAAYRAKKMDWQAYERRFIELLGDRRVAATIPKSLIDGAVLLCSEHEPARCHRRLVAEYLAEAWGGAEIVHLQ